MIVPWIEETEGFLEDLEKQSKVEVFDDGEEYGDVYVDERAEGGVPTRAAPSVVRPDSVVRQ